MKRKEEQLKELRRLQAQIEALRRDLKISSPGTVLYRSSLLVTNNDSVIVEADGFGGATTSIVEGNYPVDYITKVEKWFPSEDLAVDAADEIVEGKRRLDV